MSNSYYIPEFDDGQQAMQEMELYYYEQSLKQASEHEDYLKAIANDLYGSSVTLMTELN